MKDWFFYQERGKTIGPLTAEDLKKRIREGRLRLFDLVYRDGEDIWKMAMDFAELREEFKSNQIMTPDRPWICLKKKDRESSEFVTVGPFSVEEIKSAILAGQLAYTDYVWRYGFKEWKRIGIVEEFNDKAKKSDPLPPIPPESKDELLRAVVQAKPPKRDKAPPEEIIPAEAGTPDLIVHGNTLEKAPPVPADRRQRPRVAEKKPASEKKKKRDKKTRVVWVDWVIVALLTLGLGVSAYYVSQRAITHSIDHEVEPEFVSQDTPAVPPATATVAPAPQPETHVAAAPPPRELPKEEYHAPTQLFVAVAKGDRWDQPQVEIRTDGSKDAPVWLQLVGMPGQMADGPTFYKYTKLKATGDVRAPIDLSAIRWPQGRFYLRVSAGDLKKELQMSVGAGEASFKQNLPRIRKTHAYAIWKDRLELIKVTQRLEERLQDALKKKTFSGRGLEALEALKRTNGENYVLFDEWWEVKDIFVEAQKAPNEELLRQLRTVKDRLASYSVWKYK